MKGMSEENCWFKLYGWIFGGYFTIKNAYRFKWDPEMNQYLPLNTADKKIIRVQTKS